MKSKSGLGKTAKKDDAYKLYYLITFLMSINIFVIMPCLSEKAPGGRESHGCPKKRITQDFIGWLP